MADTQNLSSPFKLPKGNIDTSGRLPGQSGYQRNSQVGSTYKVDIPTREGQTQGSNPNNPVSVFRVGVTQPIGTITSQGGFTPNTAYYAGVSAAEEKIRRAEQRAIRAQTVEINNQAIKPTAKKAGIKQPIINNDAAAAPQSGDTSQPIDLGAAIAGSNETRNEFPSLRYPLDIGNTKQDIIKFTMLKYEPKKFSNLQENNLGGFAERPKNRQGIGFVTLPVPSGISDNNSAQWNGADLNAAAAFAANVALTAITEGGRAAANVVGQGADGLQGNSGEVKTGLAGLFGAAAVGTDPANLLSRTTGAIINPNMELLFQAPTLRPFNFTFKMSARSSEEAKQIISIIRFFKQGMSPQKSKSNLFLKAPHTFKIQYINRSLGENKDNPFIGKIKECALQSFVVNYTPEGQYATFYDGPMMSYEIQMTFQELEPVFNEDYNQGTRSNGPDTEIGY
jgi:hypothetical protein